MRVGIIALSIFILLAAAVVYAQNFCIPTAPPTAAINDEFPGPFASWINVKTGNSFGGGVSTGCSGATGNGVTDDTTNLQCQFTYSQNHQATVLYFPAGTYLVGNGGAGPALTWNVPNSSGGGEFIGHSPLDTIIKWNGSSGGTMIEWNNGLEYGVFSRMTLNGAGSSGNAGTLILASGGNGGFQALYEDDVLENATTGWSTNNTSQNAADLWVRDTFSNLGTGLTNNSNQNAVSSQLTYSTFLNNGTSINFAQGQFAVYYDVFIGSTTADQSGGIGNTTSQTLRGNVSANSAIFATANSGPMPKVYVNNRVINSAAACAFTDTYTGAPSIITVLNNQIASQAGNTTAAICTSGSGNVFSANNQFTISGTNGTNSANSYVHISGSTAKLQEAGDTTVSSASISHACPVAIAGQESDVTLSTSLNATGGGGTNIPSGWVSPCYPTAPNTTRHCFASGADQGACAATSAQDETSISNLQSDINAACPNGYTGGNRPVIHLAGGSYNLASTITIPGSCDVQIWGDAWFNGTSINWTGSSNSNMFTESSPVTARMQDLALLAANNSTGVRVNSEDNSNARVNVWNAYSQSSTSGGGLVKENGLANTLVNLYQGTAYMGSTGIYANAIGNGTASSPARIAFWDVGNMGGTNSGEVLAAVSNQGHILVDSSYIETCGSANSCTYQFANLSTGTGSIAIAGAVYHWDLTSEANIATLNGFTGNFILLGSDFGDSVNSSSNPYGRLSISSAANAVVEGNQVSDPNFSSTMSTGITVQALNNVVENTNAFVTDAGSMPLATQISLMAPIVNYAPSLNLALPAGTTDAQFEDVRIDNVGPVGFDVE